MARGAAAGGRGGRPMTGAPLAGAAAGRGSRSTWRRSWERAHCRGRPGAAAGGGQGRTPRARGRVRRGRASGPGPPELGVALVEEAQQAAAAGISAPVLVLSEPHDGRADALAADRIAVTICTRDRVRAFAAAWPGRLPGRPPQGRHRHAPQGCQPAELPDQVAAALAELGLEVEGLRSHRGRRRGRQDGHHRRPAGLFRDALAVMAAAGLSPAGVTWPTAPGPRVRADARFDLVRTGIEVYGRPCRRAGRPGPGPARAGPFLRAAVPAAARSRPGAGSPTPPLAGPDPDPDRHHPGRVRRRPAPWSPRAGSGLGRRYRPAQVGGSTMDRGDGDGANGISRSARWLRSSATPPRGSPARKRGRPSGHDRLRDHLRPVAPPAPSLPPRLASPLRHSVTQEAFG